MFKTKLFIVSIEATAPQSVDLPWSSNTKAGDIPPSCDYNEIYLTSFS